VLGSLKADWKVKTNSKSIHAWRGSTGCSCGLWSWVRLERAEHRRGIRGEEVPMSERSEFGTAPW